MARHRRRFRLSGSKYKRPKRSRLGRISRSHKKLKRRLRSTGTRKPAKKPSRPLRRRVARHEAKHLRKTQASVKRRPLRSKRHRRRSRRLMLTFSNGQRHLVVLSSRMASKNGAYLNAVRQLLHSNDPTQLEEFAGQSIKDVRGHEYPFEIRPNVLYGRNAVPEPIAEIYQVLT